MSDYFREFPKVFYKFGSNETPVYFQKLSKYVDVVDSLKEAVSAYLEYEINDFDRPDTLSYKLYGKSEYEWTFFLMNERLRECGWPMTQQAVYEYGVNEAYTGYVATLDVSTVDSAASLASIFTAGTTMSLTGGKTAVVEKQDLMNRQIYLTSDSDITSSVALVATLTDLNPALNVIFQNIVYEYNANHHYVNDSDEWVDYFSDDAFKTPVTNLEHLINENDKSKRIRIIKKQNIESVVSEFKRMVAIN